MIRMTCFVVAAILLVGCNADLKAEKVAWERLAEQRRASGKRTRECSETTGWNDAKRQLDKSELECGPYEAVVRSLPSGGSALDRATKAAAIEMMNEHPSCRETARLRDALLKRYEVLTVCSKREDDELDLRALEYMAACEKCAVKQRCDKNLKHNIAVLNHQDLLDREPQAKTAALLKQIREAGEDRFIYACGQ